MSTELEHPKWKPYVDRASARTAAEREEHYQVWLSKFGIPYSDAVSAAGDEPWFATDEERRELFMRRYVRPSPPETVPNLTVDEIRGAA